MWRIYGQEEVAGEEDWEDIRQLCVNRKSIAEQITISAVSWRRVAWAPTRWMCVAHGGGLNRWVAKVIGWKSWSASGSYLYSLTYFLCLAQILEQVLPNIEFSDDIRFSLSLNNHIIRKHRPIKLSGLVVANCNVL